MQRDGLWENNGYIWGKISSKAFYLSPFGSCIWFLFLLFECSFPLDRYSALRPFCLIIVEYSLFPTTTSKTLYPLSCEFLSMFDLGGGTIVCDQKPIQVICGGDMKVIHMEIKTTGNFRHRLAKTCDPVEPQLLVNSTSEDIGASDTQHRSSEWTLCWKPPSPQEPSKRPV